MATQDSKSRAIRQWNLKVMNRAKKTARRQMVQMVKKIAFELYRDVIFLSPVDTGRFRASWVMRAGRAVPEAPPEGEAQYPVPDALKSLRSIDNFRLGQTIWISNPVEYAVALEEGHSQQAPMGIAAVAIQRIIDSIQSPDFFRINPDRDAAARELGGSVGGQSAEG